MEKSQEEKEGEKGKKEKEGEEEFRVRLPKNKEVIGVVVGRMGASRFVVSCSDDIWIKEGDYVIVEPWEIDDKRGDIVFRYSPIQVEWLRKRNYLKDL
ncbi:MAG: translation initiation factor IF-1A [Candidatus Micrarchaeia archaeon]